MFLHYDRITRVFLNRFRKTVMPVKSKMFVCFLVVCYKSQFSFNAPNIYIPSNKLHYLPHLSSKHQKAIYHSQSNYFDTTKSVFHLFMFTLKPLLSKLILQDVNFWKSSSCASVIRNKIVCIHQFPRATRYQIL